MYEYFNHCNRARAAELRLDWTEAKRLWNLAGRNGDADACQLIIDAVARGDRFRSLVARKLQTTGLPREMSPCPAYDRILREATQEVDG